MCKPEFSKVDTPWNLGNPPMKANKTRIYSLQHTDLLRPFSRDLSDDSFFDNQSRTSHYGYIITIRGCSYNLVELDPFLPQGRLVIF
jgi:hypothetical protein